jgi:demethylmenaquinone methyltransferase/2-methoxy-6-polyprenyl-1,4-benzoquinol methylase
VHKVADPNVTRLEPHPVLSDFYDGRDQRRAFVRTLFDEAAPHYDRLNEVFSFGTGARYRHDCLVRAGLGWGQKVADIAIGTGLVAKEAIAITGNKSRVIGIDVSAGMLAVARSKLGIQLVQGSAEQLPLGSNTIDFLTMGYALRHVADLRSAFAEFHRVLRPGGTALVLEIGRPTRRLVRVVVAGYLGTLVPLFGPLAAGRNIARKLTRYYWDTIKFCVEPEAIIEAMNASGFVKTTYTTELDVFRSYCGRKAEDIAD